MAGLWLRERASPIFNARLRPSFDPLAHPLSPCIHFWSNSFHVFHTPVRPESHRLVTVFSLILFRAQYTEIFVGFRHPSPNIFIFMVLESSSVTYTPIQRQLSAPAANIYIIANTLNMASLTTRSAYCNTSKPTDANSYRPKLPVGF